MKKIDELFIKTLGVLCYLIGMVSVCLLVMMPLFIHIQIDTTLYLIGAMAVVIIAHKLFKKIFLDLHWVEDKW